MYISRLVLNGCWRLLSVSRINWYMMVHWKPLQSVCCCSQPKYDRHQTLFLRGSFHFIYSGLPPWPVTEIGKAWLDNCLQLLRQPPLHHPPLQLRCRPHPPTCSLLWFPVVCMEDGNLSANPRVFCSETESVSSYILLQPLACFK